MQNTLQIDNYKEKITTEWTVILKKLTKYESKFPTSGPNEFSRVVFFKKVAFFSIKNKLVEAINKW